MFFDIFCQLCKDKGMSANGVAKELSIASGTVSEWKKGRVPQNSTLLKIASYFDVTPDYLLGNTDQKEKPSEEGEDVVVVSRNGERFVHHLNPDQIKLLEDMIKQFGGDN